MAVRKPKDVKEPDPTEEERALLRELKFGSMLHSAHPIITTNVLSVVARLLTRVGRGGLARELESLPPS